MYKCTELLLEMDRAPPPLTTPVFSLATGMAAATKEDLKKISEQVEDLRYKMAENRIFIFLKPSKSVFIHPCRSDQAGFVL